MWLYGVAGYEAELKRPSGALAAWICEHKRSTHADHIDSKRLTYLRNPSEFCLEYTDMAPDPSIVGRAERNVKL